MCQPLIVLRDKKENVCGGGVLVKSELTGIPGNLS